MPQFDTHFLSPLTFWSVVSFGILLFLLYRYAFPVIFRLLDEREKKIRQSIEDADRARKEAQDLFAGYQNKLAAAQEEAESILERARVEARHLLEEGQKRMEHEAQQRIEEAKVEIQREQEQALVEIRGAAVDLTITATEKILERKLTESDHHRFVEDVLKEISQAKQGS